MNALRLTPAMLRELQSIVRNGELTDPIDWPATGALWFYARDRVIGALERRGLIEAAPDWTATEAGHIAVSKYIGGAV